MGKYLVTGRAGSGKSAVTRELARRGYKAFDSDEIPNLSSWVRRRNGKKVSLGDQRFVDLGRYRFVWDKETLLGTLKVHKDVFICGGADNDLDFIEYFDKTFVLDVKPDIQAQRLASRTDNEYGTAPEMLPRILENQAGHIAKAKSLGSIVVDANKPITDVVEQILNHIGATN